MAVMRLWGLACFSCLKGLELGRLVEIHDDGLPCEPFFQGFRVSRRDHWVGGDELRRAVERFHIVHLGHELGLVDSDEVLRWFEDVDPPDLPFQWAEDPDLELGTAYIADRTGHATKKLAERLGIER
jgi:hypothetical protein